jgi:molybdopterin synthase sulfur carrier subunit
MKVQVKYFASVREALGTGGETTETNATTVADLRNELIARDLQHAECLGRGKTIRVALNQTLCDEAACLFDGAEVAFFPPVTGG